MNDENCIDLQIAPICRTSKGCREPRIAAGRGREIVANRAIRSRQDHPTGGKSQAEIYPGGREHLGFPRFFFGRDGSGRIYDQERSLRLFPLQGYGASRWDLPEELDKKRRFLSSKLEIGESQP